MRWFQFAIFMWLTGGLVASDKTEVSFTWENDTFLDYFGFDYVDRHYSQGFQLQVWLPDNELKEGRKWGSLGSQIGWNLFGEWGKFGMDVERTRGGWSVGQKIYTPEVLAVGTGFVSVGPTGDQLQVNDRPYAGFLSFDAHWERRGRVRGIPTKDQVVWTLGIVGPAALGEEAQTWWHGIFDGVAPEGWRFQLDNEVVANLKGERQWLFRFGSRAGWKWDLMPSVGAEVGTVITSLNLGLETRLGFGEVGLFNLPSMKPGRDWGAYFYASARGRVVGRDIFLDGNTFSDSHSVEREVLRGEVSAGVGLRFRAFEGRVGWVRRSIEFEQQDVPNQYLSVSGTWRY